MARVVELLIALNALGGIATFLGLRLAARRTRDRAVGGVHKILHHDDDERDTA